MKKIAIVLALFFLLGCPFVVSAFMNEPDGFRGIPWGTDFKTLRGFHYDSIDPSFGGIKKYTRENDEMVIVSATLNKIVYGFWNDRFESVVVEFKNFINFTGVKNAVFEKFGDGFKSNRYIENYFWSGEKTTMMLRYREVLKIGDLYLSSNALSEEMKEYEKKRAQEGAAKGF